MLLQFPYVDLTVCLSEFNEKLFIFVNDFVGGFAVLDEVALKLVLDCVT